MKSKHLLNAKHLGAEDWGEKNQRLSEKRRCLLPSQELLSKQINPGKCYDEIMKSIREVPRAGPAVRTDPQLGIRRRAPLSHMFANLKWRIC